jgi:hypothetical protein
LTAARFTKDYQKHGAGSAGNWRPGGQTEYRK